MNYLKKIFSLLDNYKKKKIFFLLLVVFFSMLIEVLGIALIIPLLNIILNKDLVTIWLDENLPFAVQKLLVKNIISIDAIGSESEWFGVTYKEDKENSVEKLKIYSEKGFYPIPLWKN